MKAKPAKAPYHHGDLANALVDAAATVLAEKGPGRFSLREVARRAGVSVAAPSHHFGNTRGLLTAVATEGFVQLDAGFEKAVAGCRQPLDQLTALCHSYIRMTQEYPGHAAVMFRHDLVDSDDESFLAVAPASFERLLEHVGRCAPEGYAAHKTEAAAKALWAAMHGYVALNLDSKPAEIDWVAYTVGTLVAGMQ